MAVLQLVCFDVLPQTVDDDWSRLSVNTKKSGEARVELELSRLVVEHEQHSALDVLVSRSLHLETVCFLSGRRAVPLRRRSTSCKIFP